MKNPNEPFGQPNRKDQWAFQVKTHSGAVLQLLLRLLLTQSSQTHSQLSTFVCSCLQREPLSGHYLSGRAVRQHLRGNAEVLPEKNSFMKTANVGAETVPP